MNFLTESLNASLRSSLLNCYITMNKSTSVGRRKFAKTKKRSSQEAMASIKKCNTLILYIMLLKKHNKESTTWNELRPKIKSH